MKERLTTTNAMIREAHTELGFSALNKDIKDYCKTNFGIVPLSQQIYGVLGAEFERLSEAYSARQLAQTKKHIKQNFDGDFDRAYSAMKLVGSMV
jgi:hypothetical protein